VSRAHQRQHPALGLRAREGGAAIEFNETKKRARAAPPGVAPELVGDRLPVHEAPTLSFGDNPLQEVWMQDSGQVQHRSRR
jgi:hypothetical protein